MDIKLINVTLSEASARELYIALGTQLDTTTTPDPPPVQIPPQPSTAPGLYAFKTHNKADLLSSPVAQYLAGCNLTFYWSQLNPSKNVYDWSPLEAAIAPWASAGKKIILRVSSCGQTSWDPPYSGQGTPAFVYAAGVRKVTNDGGDECPTYWDQGYLDWLTVFVNNLAGKYDGDPRISFVQLAVGMGGETKPDTRDKPDRYSKWKAAGYTDQIWWQTIQKIFIIWSNAFKKTPLAIMPDSTYISGNAPNGYNEHQVVMEAIARGFGLQNNGVRKGQAPDPDWLKAKFISGEQYNSLANTTDGTTLAQYIQAAIDYGCKYILLFSEDLAKADAALLQKSSLLVKSV
jgi:hypothetical protein